MQTDISRVPVAEILPFRDLYRREMNCQIVLDSWHARGWSDAYLLRLDGRAVGYGSVGGRDAPRDLVHEFYVLPAHRAAALPLFRAFVAASGARNIEVQSNDPLLALMLYDCATGIESNVVLFADALTTNLPAPVGVTFRRALEGDRERVVRDGGDPDAGWLLEADDGAIAATGGLLFHYNVPFGDIYMRTGEAFRRRGCGSYLIQELKRACYAMGRVPAARCNASNAASRATLQKAGMLPCGRVLTGVLPV
jgi:GNAT superfamily N-acetyltransferase